MRTCKEKWRHKGSHSSSVSSSNPDIPTSQGFYEGDVFLDTQFRSPPWTRFPNHLQLLIILQRIVDLHCYYPPKN